MRRLMRLIEWMGLVLIGGVVLLGGCGGKGNGTLIVEGTGDDLYEIFDASGANKINFKTTNSEMELPSGHYTIFVNGAGARVRVRGNRKLTIKLASVVVEGTGQDLYAVFDPSGKSKLQFKNTGKTIELLPGSYQVKLNGMAFPIEVKKGDKKVFKAGTLLGTGVEHALYYIYDGTGQVKLDFRSSGKAIELFPGKYIVDALGKKTEVEVKAGEETVLDLKK